MRAAFVVALVGVAACLPNRTETPTIGDRGRTSSRPRSSDTVLSQKTVTSKVEPATLVAFDGSRCVVTESRFRETVIGENVWCVWGPSR